MSLEPINRRSANSLPQSLNMDDFPDSCTVNLYMPVHQPVSLLCTASMSLWHVPLLCRIWLGWDDGWQAKLWG